MICIDDSFAVCLHMQIYYCGGLPFGDDLYLSFIHCLFAHADLFLQRFSLWRWFVSKFHSLFVCTCRFISAEICPLEMICIYVSFAVCLHMQIYYCGGLPFGFAPDYKTTITPCAILTPDATGFSGTWSTAIRPMLDGGRNHAYTCTDGNKIFVFGGRNTATWTPPASQVYNPATNTWIMSGVRKPHSYEHSYSVEYNLVWWFESETIV